MTENEIIKEYDYLVEKIARLMFKRKAFSIIDFCDIKQAGYIGLLQAVRRYEAPYIEAQLAVYIRSRIIDEFRKYDSLTRGRRAQMKAGGEAETFSIIATNKGPDTFDPLDEYTAPEYTNVTVHWLNILNTSVLTSEQKDLFSRLMRGELMQDISEAYGESRPTSVRKKKRLITTLSETLECSI